jgi:hypothetical protein
LPGTTTVARKQLGGHIAYPEIIEETFSVWFMLGLYSEDEEI